MRIASWFNGLQRNTRVVVICASLVAGMVGMAYAAVPIYDLFCRVTGYGGTTQVAQYDPGQIIDREVTVRFDASLARGVPLEFTPLQRSMRVRLGETALAFYRVTNTSSEPVTGVASYNVAPFKTGTYFAKLECFCFLEQTIAAGETGACVNVKKAQFLLGENNQRAYTTTMTVRRGVLIRGAAD